MVSRLAESGNKGDTECGRKGNKIIRDSGYWERRYSPIEERAWRYGMRQIYVHYAGRKEKKTTRTEIEHTNPERVLIQKSTEVKVLNVFPYLIAITPDSGVVKD